MTVLLVAWPLKRAMIGRLQAIAAGTQSPPAGAELIAAGDVGFSGVQVEYALPAEPDRLCVYGAPFRAVRANRTEEPYGAAVWESDTIEIRIRVYSPGEDITGVTTMVGNLAQAVAAALLDGAPLVLDGSVELTAMSEETAVAGNPDPAVIGFAALTFTAQVMTA